MQQLIEKVLKAQGIEKWSIETVHEYSAELFFIARELDTRRLKETEKYNVKVYREFESDGEKMLGMSGASFVPGDSEEQISEGLKTAYFAASFVENPAYPLPEKIEGTHAEFNDKIDGVPAADAAMQMAEAAFSEDHVDNALLNSIEVFAVKSLVRIQTSSGTDVSYSRQEINGEFIVQSKQPVDVELYKSFRYDTIACEAIAEKTRGALKQAADRARAKNQLATGNYNVILSEDALGSLLSFYTSRTDVSMVYPGYSSWKIGDQVHKQPMSGEKLNITLKATKPYSSDGLPMADMPVIADGKVLTFHGDSRLSSYLGVKATGTYDAFTCANGTVPFEEMKKQPYLYPVAFSDFKMDIYSGHFGGEMRLAYYFDGETTHILTGGAINGSILDCSDDLVFSNERYKSLSYEGPYAVLMKNVNVSGTEA